MSLSWSSGYPFLGSTLIEIDFYFINCWVEFIKIILPWLNSRVLYSLWASLISYSFRIPFRGDLTLDRWGTAWIIEWWNDRFIFHSLRALHCSGLFIFLLFGEPAWFDTISSLSSPILLLRWTQKCILLVSWCCLLSSLGY